MSAPVHTYRVWFNESDYMDIRATSPENARKTAYAQQKKHYPHHMWQIQNKEKFLESAITEIVG